MTNKSKKITNKTEREIAAGILGEVLSEGAYSNVALRRGLAEQSHFGRVQKAFVTELVSGCVRNLMLIDHIISNFSKTPIGKIKPRILNILRISVYQLKFMDKVPMHAVCDEAVKMAKGIGLAGLSGFVNGVLRNIARGDVPMPDDLSVRYSVQKWIACLFLKELGEDATRELLENIMLPPNITLSVNTLKTDAANLQDRLEKEGLDVAPGLLPNVLRVSKTADIAASPSFAQGLFHIMDEAAVMAVLCADIPKDACIIDVCAAPGGKIFQAAYLAGKDAELFAFDIHPHKIKLLQEGAKRLGLGNVNIRQADAAVFDESLENTADLLILDVPCSGLGTLRRKADIKLNKQPEDLENLAKLARDIINASWRYVKPGGKMLFSTCTISNAENIQNFRWILENLPFAPVDFSGKLPQRCDASTARQGYFQVLPQYFNTDGFFISVLERVE